ncbi:phage tail tape measure protein [Candidatus Fukatsuia endosymbiont of Tuberolachnus salignus]|uniref:phage tail tape measure protein n=1 Tax=Candidatus Fukatsuia endosymbiont of Tuberolachnus salignus TaxID=3077957 RepID=UPI00313D9712
MTEIATISLRVDTSNLEKGDRALAHFGDTAARTAAQAEDFNSSFTPATRTLNAFGHQTHQANLSLQQQRDELHRLLGKIHPVTAAFGKLDEREAQLRRYKNLPFLDKDTFDQAARAIHQARDELAQAAQARTAEGRAAAAQAAADKVAAQAKNAFIAKLREQSECQGKTTAEILAYKAAQLGVTQQAAPFIATLREQENSWKKGTISAGQYRMALRQLPMQFTDIATSIAGGMPLYLIAIQQGGQIRDSFGGIANALKAMGQWLTPTKILLGGAATALASVGLAYYRGAQESSTFNKQLILTGQYAGKTATQLQQLAKRLSGDGLTQSALSAALAQVVGSGAFDSTQIEQVSVAAAKMAAATGQSVDDTVKHFTRLQEEPLTAVKALDKQLHFLTASEYEQIAALERAGNTLGAARLAMEAYANALKTRADDIVANLGTMEKAWYSLKNTAKSAWNAMLDIGRDKTIQDELALAEAHLNAARKGFFNRTRIKELENKKTALLEKQFQDELTAARKKAHHTTEAIEKAALQRRDHWRERYANQAQQRSKELKKFNEIATRFSPQEQVRIRAAIEARFPDEKRKKSPNIRQATGRPAAVYRDDAATRALLESRQRVAMLREQATLTASMNEQEKQQVRFTQQIADLKTKSLLTADQQSLLARAKEINASLQLEAQLSRENSQRQKALAALKQMEDTSQSLARRNAQQQARFGLTDKQAKRVDQTFQLDNTYQKQKEGITDAEQLEKITAAYLRAKQELHTGFHQEKMNEGNWLAGMKQGITEYGETATHVFAATQKLANHTLGNLSSMMTELTTTGQANLKSFATAFLTNIVDIINRLLIAQAIQAAMGWIGGAFTTHPVNAASSNALGTGVMGINTRWSSNVPSHAKGGYTGEGDKYQPAGIVHKGEFVMTKDATERIGVDNLYALIS